MFNMINSFPFDRPSFPDTLSHDVFLNHQDSAQTSHRPWPSLRLILNQKKSSAVLDLVFAKARWDSSQGEQLDAVGGSVKSSSP